MTDVTPSDITHNKKTNQLLITWSDNRTCAYPISALRLACPCAECRGGHENMGRHNDPKSLNDLLPLQESRIERLEIVGNYALQPIWEDGHSSGIYTWEYLWRLCPAEDPDA